jgi:hypothetical protein
LFINQILVLWEIDIQNLFAELVKREPDHVEVTAFDALDQGSTSSLKTKTNKNKQ